MMENDINAIYMQALILNISMHIFCIIYILGISSLSSQYTCIIVINKTIDNQPYIPPKHINAPVIFPASHTLMPYAW